jgi:hypothetical protein
MTADFERPLVLDFDAGGGTPPIAIDPSLHNVTSLSLALQQALANISQDSANKNANTNNANTHPANNKDANDIAKDANIFIEEFDFTQDQEDLLHSPIPNPIPPIESIALVKQLAVELEKAKQGEPLEYTTNPNTEANPNPNPTEDNILIDLIGSQAAEHLGLDINQANDIKDTPNPNDDLKDSPNDSLPNSPKDTLNPNSNLNDDKDSPILAIAEEAVQIVVSGKTGNSDSGKTGNPDSNPVTNLESDEIEIK